MNIAALKNYVETEGKEFKNYRHLCEVLEVKSTTGNAKKAQIKELERYFKLEKGKGYRLIVGEIYNTPKEKEINRRNDIYGEMLQLAIMDYLINSKRSKTTATRNYLLGQVEMINHNYRLCSNNRKKFAQYTNIDIDIINDFFNISNGNFRRILERSLDELEDKSIIKYKIVTIINDSENRERKATDEEIELILECEKIVLNEMEYSKKSEVRVSGKWNQFNKKVKELLSEESDINYYYSSYEISVNKKFIRDEREKVKQYIIDETQRIENRDRLTSTLSNNLINNAKKRQDKARRTHDMNRINKRARSTFSYVDDVQTIVNYVINPYSKPISKELYNVVHKTAYLIST